MTLERPRQEWLVEDMIPKPGLSVLLGQPFEGKSFLALQLALAVAQGHPDFLGKAVKKGTVWYLQLDTSELLWRERLVSLKASGVDIGGVKVLHPDDTPIINIIMEPDQRWFRAALAEADPDLVIIDVLRELHLADENDSTGMKRVGDQLTSLFRGRSVLLIHHTRKIPADVEFPDPRTFSRGSSYVMGKADIGMILHNKAIEIHTRAGARQRFKVARNANGLWIAYQPPKRTVPAGLHSQPAVPEAGLVPASPTGESAPE